jgi:hypothetical protein
MTSRGTDMTIGISQIVWELAALREKMVSGTYVVSTKGGNEAHVSVDRGEVSAVRYRGQKYPPLRLLDALGGVRASATSFVRAASQPEPRQPLARPNNFDLVDAEAYRVVCAHLVEVLGPFAGFICEEKTVPNQSVEALLALVSQEIDDPHRAQAFRAAVRSELARR